MLYLALAFCIVMPIFGVAEMENGAVSPFISESGSPNGATTAYFIHIIAFFGAFYWIVKKYPPRTSQQADVHRVIIKQARIDKYAYFCALIFSAFALILIFGFDAKNVLSLTVDKAEFRISLGPLGPIITLARIWYIPALFAVLIRLCIDYGWNWRRVLLTSIAGIALFIFGAANGFKTTALQMLLPSIIVAAWEMRPRVVILSIIFLAINIVGFALFLDGHGALDIALEALWYRVTVLQSDLTWYTWEVAKNGGELPKYMQTFLPVLGDSILRHFTGADPDKNFLEWANYYYGLSMTLFGGYPIEGVLAGVNNQATLFAEAVIIGGDRLFPLISFVFGVVIGKIAVSLKMAIQDKQYERMGSLATLFAFPVLMWTLGNGFSSLLYLINLFGLLTTFLMIRFLLPRNYPTRQAIRNMATSTEPNKKGPSFRGAASDSELVRK